MSHPKPQIRLIGKGTILPSTDGQILPFEAIGLKAIQVQIVKVHQDNIPQFLQVNKIGGREQTQRVGKIVTNKTILLEDKAEDLTSWNRFTLDLTSLFDAEKGAIYQVAMSMRPDFSVLSCETDFGALKVRDDAGPSWSIYEGDGFSAYDGYDRYYYPPGYRWAERNNPCHIFLLQQRPVSLPEHHGHRYRFDGQDRWRQFHVCLHDQPDYCCTHSRTDYCTGLSITGT